MKIKKAFLLLPIAMLSQSGLFAAPICGTATLAVYQSYGAAGCTLGANYVFSSFSYVASVSVNTNAITASNITVTASLLGNNPGFGFSANWGTSNSALPSSYTGVIGFHGVSNAPLFSAFNSLTLATTGSTSGLLSVANVNELDCVGGVFSGTPPVCLSGGVGATVGASISGSSTSANAVISFSPATSIDVLKTIDLTSTGTLISPAFANLSSVSQRFGTGPLAPVPEPGTYLLSGLALATLVHLRRKTA